MAIRRRKRTLFGGGRRRIIVLVGAGVAAMYFFDPDRGRTRRAKLADQVPALFRRGARKTERAGRYVAAESYGVKQKVAHLGSDEQVPPNDPALVAKIESEVLRGNKYPKGDINVNAENGVVYLRGELDNERAISELEQEVRKVTGVVDVRNLLHVPGQPAPNKEAARTARS